MVGLPAQYLARATLAPWLRNRTSWDVWMLKR